MTHTHTDLYVYHSTLLASAQIILFLEKSKFSNTFLKEIIFEKENCKIFWTILFFEMESSKSINYLTNKSWSCQHTMVYIPLSQKEKEKSTTHCNAETKYRNLEIFTIFSLISGNWKPPKRPNFFSLNFSFWQKSVGEE